MEAAPSSQSTASVPSTAKTRLWLSYSLAILAGALLRFWMLRSFFEVSGDSQIYGELAKNLLLHGRYALIGETGILKPTLIRLPGYPLFLATCFRLFGMENYYSATLVQIVLELLGCILLASAARRIAPMKFRSAAAHATLWLAAICPFTAIFAAEPLTESLSVFSISLVLWAAARFQDLRDWTSALSFTFAVTFAAFLRPDGALAAVAFVPALLFCVVRTGKREPSKTNFARSRVALVCLLLALAPFCAWTVRNWRVFHVVQPLAPRYANDPGEETWPGWQCWVRTWSLDFISTFQIYWNVPDGPLNTAELPDRAFDSPAQRAETARLAAGYEANKENLSPALDARFAELARQRIAAHPMRYYLWLPLGRVADMWLRPRVENLNIDLDWWVYGHHWQETSFSWFYAGLNALYLLLAILGVFLRPRLWFWMLLYMILRSAMLAVIEAPEARYTIECFPMLFMLGGVALGRLLAPRRPAIW